METCFNYCDIDKGFFSSDERRWINKIRKLKEIYPDDIRIIAEPETNDGCIYCQLPTSWLKIQPKRKIDMSDEERAVLAERLRSIRKNISETPRIQGENEGN